MLRISWPLAILLAAVIVLMARRPQLVVPILIVFAVWFVWQLGRRKRR